MMYDAPRSPIASSKDHHNAQYSCRSNSIVKSSSRSCLDNLSAVKLKGQIMVPLTEEVIISEMKEAFNYINLESYNSMLRIKKP